MPHAIDTTDGISSFANVRSDAWHQLGQVIPEGMTIETALDAAFMRGWKVRKLPLEGIVIWDDELKRHVTISVPGKYATVRTNPVRNTPGDEQVDGLGVVGRVWTAYQMEIVAALMNDLVDASGAHVETIGSLRGGRDTFITMLLPDHIELTSPTGVIDRTALYLALLNNHTGDYPLRALISPTRIVCANTQQMAEGNAISTATLKHTGEPQARLSEIRRLLGMSFAYQDAFSMAMQAMIDAQRDDDFVKAALASVFDVKGAKTERAANGRIAKATQVMEIYRQSPTVAPFYGTNYGAYNALTEYVDHYMPTARKADKQTQRAMRSLTSTDAHALKLRAFEAFTPA